MVVIIFILGIICVYLILARFVICKIRRSDKRAKQIFKDKNVPLDTCDEIVDERNMHYVVSGSAILPTLVFIHGTPASWFRFEKLMLDEELRSKFRIVCIDRPGFGYSDFGKPLPLQDQCKLILSILKKMKNDQPLFLCGHSYGGAVVAQLAVDAPELFERLIILAGAIDPGQEKEDKGLKKIVDTIIGWLLPGAWRTMYAELSYFRKDLQHLAKGLDKIKAPVLFIHGEKDKVVPVNNVDYGKRMMTNAASVETHIIKTASHQLPMTHDLELKALFLELIK